MIRYICKISWTGGQCRVTIPKRIVKQKKWITCDYIQLDDIGGKAIVMKGVFHEQTNKAKSKGCATKSSS